MSLEVSINIFFVKLTHLDYTVTNWPEYIGCMKWPALLSGSHKIIFDLYKKNWMKYLGGCINRVTVSRGSTVAFHQSEIGQDGSFRINCSSAKLHEEKLATPSITTE